MPDMDDLALAVDAADRANFGAVARARHVSQSTVSRAVRRVESALGAALFEREGRAVRVAADATVRLDLLRDLVAKWNALLAPPPGLQSLAIFCTVTASQTIVPDLLATFRRTHPGVVLHLRTGPASGALDAVLRGEVDAAIAPLPQRLPQRLVSAEVATTPLIAVAAPDVRGWHDARIILPREGLTRDLAEGWCRRTLPAGFTIIDDTESHEEVVALAALGCGIGIVPKLVVDTSALRPRLRELPTPRRLPTMRIGLCARGETIESGPLALLWSMLT